MGVHRKTQPRTQDAQAQTVEKGETATTVRSQRWVPLFTLHRKTQPRTQDAQAQTETVEKGETATTVRSCQRWDLGPRKQVSIRGATE